jgi:hypothetical protein
MRFLSMTLPGTMFLGCLTFCLHFIRTSLSSLVLSEKGSYGLVGAVTRDKELAHGKDKYERTIKKQFTATTEDSARQWTKTAHGKNWKYGKGVGCCRALPFVVGAPGSHGNAAFAVRSSLCHAPYGIFLCFSFYFISSDTYIYFFN